MASSPLRAPSLRRRAAMLQAAAAVVLCVLAAAVLLAVGAARLRGQVRTIEASQNEAARHAFAFRLDADADGGRRIRDRLSNGARGTDALFGSYRRRV